MENSERKLKEEEIKRVKLHFKYTASILFGISILIVALVFYDKDVASTYLTYAGTTLSIVLSVIAILITLIDVAGQKKQVYEIYNTSEELKSLVENHRVATNNMEKLMTSQQESLELYQKNIEKVDNVIRELMNSLYNEKTEINSEVESKENDRNQSPATNNESRTTNDNGLVKMNTPKSVSGQSEIINGSFFIKKYKTFNVSKELDSSQENEINNILNSFKTIKVQFYSNKVELYYQTLDISPFVDSDYQKQRACILVERFLRNEGLIR
ncbi:hypothetical protein [Staphylococcus hominis]|uniref:hypothetical protein n=1 Tax=Staphylococcus hominis TaxID=1290 RepID=UPI001F590548|nr:hypothetical protein [Staphylococcus hominis]MCI2924790.1 hypothetical protein [Staphylococcus hominis]